MSEMLGWVIFVGVILGLTFYPQIYSWALEQDMKKTKEDEEKVK